MSLIFGRAFLFSGAINYWAYKKKKGMSAGSLWDDEKLDPFLYLKHNTY